MAGNNRSGLRKLCDISAEKIEAAYYDYISACENSDRAPSLPDFLGNVNRKHRTRLTEDVVKEILSIENTNTYIEHQQVFRCVLMGLRGEYLSNPKWAGAMSTKAVLALGKDFGDGVSYSQKDNGSKAPDKMRILFGDQDITAKDAAI